MTNPMAWVKKVLKQHEKHDEIPTILGEGAPSFRKYVRLKEVLYLYRSTRPGRVGRFPNLS